MLYKTSQKITLTNFTSRQKMQYEKKIIRLKMKKIVYMKSIPSMQFDKANEDYKCKMRYKTKYVPLIQFWKPFNDNDQSARNSRCVF